MMLKFTPHITNGSGVLNSMDANDFLEIPNVIAVQLASGLFQYDIPELFVKKILKHLIVK